MANPPPSYIDSTRSTSPIFVIGLDGGTFDTILPLAAQGELPTFSRLMAKGAWGALQSTIPPVSPQAWSSFLTGVHPGRHGIFGFLGAPQGRFYRRPILSARDIQVPTLLQIASEAGRRVAAFGVPMTYPPMPINGVLVPEQHGPPLSHPPHLWDEIVAAVGDPHAQAIHLAHLFVQDKQSYIERQRELLEIQCRAIRWLLEREPYDLFIAVFTATSCLSRFLWEYMDFTRSDHYPEWTGLLGDALLDLYRRLDTIIGELWARLGPDGTLIVMSSYGFGPLHKHVYINRWLWREGLLAVHPLAYPLASVRSSKFLQRLSNAVARWLGLPYSDKPFGYWQKPIGPNLYEPRFGFSSRALINWRHTQAYGNSGGQGICINLQGREPNGTIAPGAEYKALRHEICQRILSVTDPDDGLPVVDHVWHREELYSGPCLKQAPDLVIQLRDHHYNLSPEIFVSDVVAPAQYMSGTYHPKGICLLAGPAIQPGAALKEASVLDLSPMTLHLLGIPVPRHMEGRVLEEALVPEWQQAYPVSQVTFAGEARHRTDGGLSAEEATAIEAHLRSLGYIG